MSHVTLCASERDDLTIDHFDGATRISAATSKSAMRMGIVIGVFMAGAPTYAATASHVWQCAPVAVVATAFTCATWAVFATWFWVDTLTISTVVHLDSAGLHYRIASRFRAVEWALPWAWIGDARPFLTGVRVGYSGREKAYVAFPMGTRRSDVKAAVHEIESFRSSVFAGRQE